MLNICKTLVIEKLATRWFFAKFSYVSTFQSYPSYGIQQVMFILCWWRVNDKQVVLQMTAKEYISTGQAQKLNEVDTTDLFDAICY